MRSFLLVSIVLLPHLAMAQGAVPQAQGASSSAVSNAQLERARTLFEEGLVQSDLGNFRRALEKFRLSLQIVERPSTVFNVANAYLKTGQPVEAASYFERFLAIATGPENASRQDEGQNLLARARAAIAHLSLVVSPEQAGVSLDGLSIQDPMHISLNPGTHTVSIRMPGYETEQRTVQLVEGQYETIRIELMANGVGDASSLSSAPLAESPPARADDSSIVSKWWFWTAMGVAVAGGITAGILLSLPDDPEPIRGDIGTDGVVSALTFK